MTPRAARVVPVVAAFAAMAANALVLYHFHDTFWAAADEGYYAHIAERLLDGEVLNGQVETYHAGYLHFVNAAALGLFGRTLLALRYPLVVAAFLASLLVFVLFRVRGPVIAAIASFMFTALGVLQFLSASPYWYALLGSVGTVTWLSGVAPGTRGRIVGAGFLVGMTGLFQQLPGALTAAAVVTWLLIEASDGTRRAAILARAMLVVLLVAVVLLLYPVPGVAGVLLFGPWPILVLVWALAVVSVPDRVVLRLLAALGFGATIAALPLVAYHVQHGSVGAWFQDTALRPGAVPHLSFLGRVSFATWVTSGAGLLAPPHGIADLANGVYWLGLTFAAAGNGALLLMRLVRRGGADVNLVLPVVAAFNGLVALRYQIPAYLYFTVGLSLAGVLWLASERPGLPRTLAATLLGVLGLVGVRWHAAIPFSSLEGVLNGVQPPLAAPDALPRCGLRVDQGEAALYAALLAVITRETQPDEPIVAMPYSPEVYFLSGRRNPLRWVLLYSHLIYASADEAIGDLAATHPRLVIHKPADKYNEPITEPVVATVRGHYDLIAHVGPFDVYRPR